MAKLSVCSLVCLLLLGMSSPALAAPEAAAGSPVPDAPAKVAARVTAVTVQLEGNDSIGARLGTALKEQFNTSSLFRLTSRDEAKLVLIVTTAPEFPSRPSVGSVYSVIWGFSQADGYLYLLLDKQVGTVAGDEIDALVPRLVEKTDGLSVKYSSLWKK
ncbi:MAG: hypothetical protein Q4F72_02355 [Desulfovibrionaceae bacterium]|nr:hypothetical protein [Desulfovibrionaceae bacterium]